MSALAVAYNRPRHRHDTPLDSASRALLRSVMAENWKPEEAARELLRRLDGNGLLLRLLRARVSRVLLARPTEIGTRAAATLDYASSALASAEAGAIPAQRRGDG